LTKVGHPVGQFWTPAFRMQSCSPALSGAHIPLDPHAMPPLGGAGSQT
jgi:hypothetical protein